MNKFTDEYFKEKVEKFMIDNPRPKRDYEHQMYLLLKEVARDVRHALAEVRAENPKEDEDGKIDHLFRYGFDEGQNAHANKCLNI